MPSINEDIYRYNHRDGNKSRGIGIENKKIEKKK
jgi:hypothetical protein